MMLLRSFLFCCFWSLTSFAGAKDVSVLDFGAKEDGITINTIAIQKAIDVCSRQGGGRVIFPKGDFLSGTVEFRDHVVLYFEKGARLLGSTRLEEYRNPDPFTEGLGIAVGWALVAAVDCQDIGIEGEGIIDGQGAKLKAVQILCGRFSRYLPDRCPALSARKRVV